uniref:Uncharacterized protein n=1 Tax=Branchiostoma floridae TaxID=7739 RepID=C3YZ70_BRAFL|eukprot:XP_002598566.1 hypothetical protein BRAFLDRAFT_66957 [Branchiostoma floridae]
MQAAHADLSHVRDCPDSTPEPVVQHEVQSQRRSYRSSLAGQTDASPGHTEDPLPDVRSDASFEHSNQDDGPCFSPNNIGDRPSLPVSCSSYTHVGQTEQNQALYVDNPLIEAEKHSSKHIYSTEVDDAEGADLPDSMSGCPSEAEEPPSKHIYGTDVENVESVVQYQLRDGCHKEAVSTFYQCGQDVDDASMDKRDVEVCGVDSEAENIGHDEIQTETVVQQSEDVESSGQNRTESEVMSDDDCIRPYAVAYNQYGHRRTADEQGDAFDIQPYAVTYDEDKGHCGNQTSTAGNGLIPNPMYSGNALQLNPAYVPNVRQPQAGGGQRHASAIIMGVAVAGLFVLTALFISTFIPGKQDSFTPTAWPNPAFTAHTDESRHVDHTSTPVDYTSSRVVYTSHHVDYTSPNLGYTSPQPTSTEGKEQGEVEETTSAVGGKKHEAGKLREQCSVVASPSKEVFMSGASNRRVMILDPRGLRSFSTIASETGCETIAPDDISFGGRGRLWGIGNCYPPAAGLIVRYTKKEPDTSTLHPFLPINTFLGILVEALGDRRVKVTFYSDYLLITVRHESGTVVRKFRMRNDFRMQTGWGDRYPGLVTVGRGGNLSVADHWDIHVYAYNGSGHHLLSFGDGDMTEIMTIFGMCISKCIFPHY